MNIENKILTLSKKYKITNPFKEIYKKDDNVFGKLLKEKISYISSKDKSFFEKRIKETINSFNDNFGYKISFNNSNFISLIIEINNIHHKDPLKKGRKILELIFKIFFKDEIKSKGISSESIRKLESDSINLSDDSINFICIFLEIDKQKKYLNQRNNFSQKVLENYVGNYYFLRKYFEGNSIKVSGFVIRKIGKRFFAFLKSKNIGYEYFGELFLVKNNIYFFLFEINKGFHEFYYITTIDKEIEIVPWTHIECIANCLLENRIPIVFKAFLLKSSLENNIFETNFLNCHNFDLDHIKSSFETNLEFNLISLIESTLLNTDLISLDGVKNNFL